MLTTEEIAEAQVVSINTIKTHLKSIYQKLSVNGRREAVEAGRLAGIPDGWRVRVVVESRITHCG